MFLERNADGFRHLWSATAKYPVLAPGPILDIPSFSGNTDGTFPEILDH